MIHFLVALQLIIQGHIQYMPESAMQQPEIYLTKKTCTTGSGPRRAGSWLRPRLLAGQELVELEMGRGGLHQDEEGQQHVRNRLHGLIPARLKSELAGRCKRCRDSLKGLCVVARNFLLLLLQLFWLSLPELNIQ